MSGTSGTSPETTSGTAASGPSRLLQDALGKKVKLVFFDDMEDADLCNAVCTITGFEGTWMKVQAQTKAGHIEKPVAISSVLSLEFAKEA